MISNSVLEELDRLGFGANIDSLEEYVLELQDEAGKGTPIVDDSVYDKHYKLLKMLKPESIVFNRNWEVEDNEYSEDDLLLQKYGMKSILTIGEYGDLDKFADVLDEIGEPVDIIASIKENGHAARAVYRDGYLCSGSTRGRYKKGRDITRHLKKLLPNYVEDWKDEELVEVRGEILVSIPNFENHLIGILKTPLSSVTSLIKESATDEEIELLDMVCYKILKSDEDNMHKTLLEEYSFLYSHGFKVPQTTMIKGVDSSNLVSSVSRILGYFEGLMENDAIQYSCDGVVISLNDMELFYSLGADGNHWKGNFAAKMGYWESNVYSSIINEVVFIPGKSYITPKAMIEPVVANNGSTIKTVPLYNIGVMERYRYIPGETIFFKYGGEQGVSLCSPDGRSVRVEN